MVQPTVWLHYRPVRIGWVVTSGDLAEFQKAVRLSTCLWGGRYNPVVPTGNLDLARNLVRTFEVDLLIPLKDASASNRVVEAFPHLVAGMEGHVVFSAGEPRRCIYTDVYHPVRRLHEDGSRTTEESKLRVIRPVWNPDDRFASLLTALFGDYPEPSTTGLDYREMLKKWGNAVDFWIGPDDAVDPLIAKAARPLVLTELGIHPVPLDPWRATGVVIGSCSSFQDLLLLWNLRATGASVQFYDPVEASRLRPWLDSFLAEVRERDIGRSRCINVWSTREKAAHDLDLSDLDSVYCIERDAETWNGLNIKAPKVSFTDFHIDVIPAYSEGPEGRTVRFPLPQKPFYTDDPVSLDNALW